MTAKGTPKPQKTWTTSEVRAASALWKNGATITAIAAALGRGRGSVDTKIKGDRKTFPPRNVARRTTKAADMKVRLTPFMLKTVRAEAAARNVSVSNLIQKVLRDALLAGKP